jgi:hypothetical protein
LLKVLGLLATVTNSCVAGFGKEGSERTFAAHPFGSLFTVSIMTSQFEVRIDLPKKTVTYLIL